MSLRFSESKSWFVTSPTAGRHANGFHLVRRVIEEENIKLTNNAVVKKVLKVGTGAVVLGEMDQSGAVTCELVK